MGGEVAAIRPAVTDICGAVAIGSLNVVDLGLVITGVGGRVVTPGLPVVIDTTVAVRGWLAAEHRALPTTT